MTICCANSNFPLFNTRAIARRPIHHTITQNFIELGFKKIDWSIVVEPASKIKVMKLHQGFEEHEKLSLSCIV